MRAAKKGDQHGENSILDSSKGHLPSKKGNFKLYTPKNGPKIDTKVTSIFENTLVWVISRCPQILSKKSPKTKFLAWTLNQLSFVTYIGGHWISAGETPPKVSLQSSKLFSEVGQKNAWSKSLKAQKKMERKLAKSKKN